MVGVNLSLAQFSPSLFLCLPTDLVFVICVGEYLGTPCHPWCEDRRGRRRVRSHQQPQPATQQQHQQQHFQNFQLNNFPPECFITGQVRFNFILSSLAGKFCYIKQSCITSLLIILSHTSHHFNIYCQSSSSFSFAEQTELALFPINPATYKPTSGKVYFSAAANSLLIGTSVQCSSWSVFGRSTGNNVSGHYKQHYFPVFPRFCPPPPCFLRHLLFS